jgi:hypothetical protein
MAAQFLAIAAEFTGAADLGARWLLNQEAPASAAPVPRPVFRQAVRLADPTDEFAALRATPGGTNIADAWKDRSVKLAHYRSLLPAADPNSPAGAAPRIGTRHVAGLAPNAVLDGLLHCHFLRAVGIDPADKAIGLYLARAAAHAFTARARAARDHS